MPQLRNVLGCSDPDNIPIDGKIGVDGDVAETDDIRPRNFRMTVSEGFGQSCGCFADDLQLLQDRAANKIIAGEIGPFRLF